VSEHEEFRELCALYTSGDLTDEQVTRLDQHLKVCPNCRMTLQEFQEIETIGLAALAADFATEPGPDESTSAPAEDQTHEKLFPRIEKQIMVRQTAAREAVRVPFASIRRSPHAGWRARTLLPYAAAALLTAGLSFYSYRAGARRVADVSEAQLKSAESNIATLRTQIEVLSKERQTLNVKVQESGRIISALTQKIALQLDELASLRDEAKNLTDTASAAQAKSQALDAERDAVNRRLADAQASLVAMQRDLAAARGERANDITEAASLAKRVQDLSAALKDRDAKIQEQGETVQQQSDLLAYDRDIRDLMGARDLYVAEVTDVGRDGDDQKPFGRVFFTKGKSLVFYAYDLDKQPQTHHVSTFQAWGRQGVDFGTALPLGILYLDNSSNRRWVLKFDDPVKLAKIDALFVTVEPKGGSQKPTSKPLLFAYLKVEPNHP
jgi:hypothetical protein